MAGIPLRHGSFLPPFHPMNENPAACIERDLELMQWLDRLGFDEAWIGEHHSAARAMFDRHEAEQKAKTAAMARPLTGKEAW